MKASSSADLAPFISINSLMQPHDLSESAWLEHAPFAFWLVENVRCSNFVELGTHTGFSYFCFCQIIQRLSLGSSCYAVDTWEGDEHSGFYDGSVFQSVLARNSRYDSFSTLMKSSFDEAVNYFPDKSIDLLHIDGRHFYDDAKHDFETWLPKLTDEAVVLFHDTNVRQKNFGVWKLFHEVSANLASFEFTHGHGLGIVAPRRVPEALSSLFSADEFRTAGIRQIYSQLGLNIRRLFYSQKAELELQEHLASMKLEETRFRNRLADMEMELLEVRGNHRAFAERAVHCIQHAILALSRSVSGRVLNTPAELTTKKFAFKARPTQLLQDLKSIVESPLFDPEWYAKEYPEVREEKDPALHFLKYGGKYALAAGPYFDTKKYLETLGDIDTLDQNPLVHFLKLESKAQISVSLAKHLLGTT